MLALPSFPRGLGGGWSGKKQSERGGDLNGYKRQPEEGKVVRPQAGLPGLLWEVSGTHPGAAPASRGPPQVKAQRGQTLVLPAWGAGWQGEKEGVTIQVPHPPFPTLREVAVGAGTFLGS